MTSFYLSFPNDILIQFKSSLDLDLDDRARTLLEAYAPGINLISETSLTPNVIIEHDQSGDKKLVRSENRVLISDVWEKELPLDFYHLLYSIVRVELMKHNLFSVHAACVGKDGYILIVGHTGVGKTSIVLELLKNRGLLMLSGNKTVVSFKQDGLEAIAGTSTLTAHQKDIERHLGETETISYGGRAALKPKGSTNKPGLVKAIVIASLNDGVAENNLIEPISALHRLYPYFLDTVNADTIMCDGKAVYVGAPSPGTQEKLAQQLHESLSEIPTYSISGSINFVCDSIIKEYEKA